MEEITIGNSHVNKPVYKSKRNLKKKPIVKVMINTRNSKRINMKMLKKDIKIIKYGEGTKENPDSPKNVFEPI